MKVEAQTIDELIQRSGDQKETIRQIDDFIRQVVPQLERKLYSGPSITMIGYGELEWKGKKKRGTWPLVSLAPQKGSTNLYIAGVKEGQPLPVFYKSRLGKVSVGKACIRVRRMENLDLDALQALLKDAVTWMENTENRYGRDCAKPVD